MLKCARLAGAILGLTVATVGQMTAQVPPPAAAKTFDVASVKPNKEGGPSSVRLLHGGTVTITNNNLRNMIRNVYNITNAQIVGGPDWIDSERFDITAKAATPFNQDEARGMLQALLAERFGLRTHTEQRELPVYLLTLSRKDGTLGPKMTKSGVDCRALFAAVAAGGQMPERDANGALPCGISVRAGQGLVVGNAVAMEALARNLIGGVGRIVVDRTGLTGNFDIHLTFAPDPGQALPPGAQPPAVADPSAPSSLFTALQEQLGLKLEPGRAPVEVVVIDQVERPSPD